LKDQSAQFVLNYPWKAAAASGLVSPVEKKAAPVPLDHRFRLCDAQPSQGLGIKAVEPAPNEPIGWRDHWWVTPGTLKHAELMTKREEFNLQ